MQLELLSLVLWFPFTTFTFLLHSDDSRSRNLLSRALTPNNSCGNVANGNGMGYRCDPNGDGCCSQYGYCGLFGRILISVRSYRESDKRCRKNIRILRSRLSDGLRYLWWLDHTEQVSVWICQRQSILPERSLLLGCWVSTICSHQLTNLMETDIVVILPTTVEITASRISEAAPLQSWAMVTPADLNLAVVAARPESVVPQRYVSAMCDGHELEAELATQGYCGTTKEYCSDPDCQFKYGTCDSDMTPAGASTLSGYRPLLGQVPYNSDITDCIEDNVVALTYDDGPYLYTSQLLDILKQFGWHATFFVTGNNNGKGPIDTTAPYPDLLRRMVAEGHQVASHTWSHYSLDEITSDMRKQQMAKNERAIANIIGKYPTYMRPPYSQCATAGCMADLQALGYHRVYFDLDTTDYLNPLPSMIQKAKDVVNAALLDKSSLDYISIQHDTIEQSVTNLTPYFYNLIKSKGWKGVTVGECLQDPKGNWYRTP